MIRKLILGLMCLLSISAFATPINIAAPSKCGFALPIDHPSFCASFKEKATCYCKETGLPEFFCTDMNALYNRMVAVYGTLEKACSNQTHTSSKDCVNNWNCYRKGGIQDGKSCSSTQKACV